MADLLPEKRQNMDAGQGAGSHRHNAFGIELVDVETVIHSAAARAVPGSWDAPEEMKKALPCVLSPTSDIIQAENLVYPSDKKFLNEIFIRLYQFLSNYLKVLTKIFAV
jgi:hypothetical protein